MKLLRQLRAIFSQVPRHAGTKLFYHAAVGAWIIVFYYGPQAWPLFPARLAPALAIDGKIPFQPGWAPVYQSVFIIHTLAFWLPGDHDSVKRYAHAIMAAFGIGAVVFWLYPTLSPRPAQGGSILYTWLIPSVDGLRNAFPSLHATMSLLGVCALSTHLRTSGVSIYWRLLLALWWIALLYSTLATHQHTLADLIAGICWGLLLAIIFALGTRTNHRHETTLVCRPQPIVL